MVKIRKGNHETLVSKGAYESIFKPLGYTLAEVKKEMPKKNDEPVNDFKGKNNKKQED